MNQSYCKKDMQRPFGFVWLLVFCLSLAILPNASQAAETYQFLNAWGSLGSGNGQFNLPSGISKDASGNIYVADTNNHRIQKFDASGVFMSAWGSLGSGNGQFNNPRDIAVDASGNVYVVDTLNHRIQKFNSGGVYVSKWGSIGIGNGQFINPTGVEVDASGNVYVVDTLNNRIQKFNSSGVFISKWGSLGAGNGQFNNPFGAAVDVSGNVYVADSSNHRIQKFNSSGVFISKWGSVGTGDGQFNLPFGVAVDDTGNIFVADYGNHRIQKFDSGSAFITKWGSYGSGNGQFINPYGVALNATGNVYVSDANNHRMQKFELACVDNDGDGYGSPGAAICPNGIAEDCDDNNAAINPGATEVCNGADDNCNGNADEGVQSIFYQDADSDLYGNASLTTLACTQPSGYVSNGSDCNDGNAFISPAANEVCNGADDNCNTLIDEGVQNTYFQDSDNDSFGNALVSALACTQPSGYVSNSADCNDGNVAIYPGALELCNSIDDNCNGQVDENVTYTYYVDADGDGYGNPANNTLACSQPTGYVQDNTDCDDTNISINPGATDIPNDGIDQDCSGADNATTSRLGNISTRGPVQTGDSVMIGGFIISGTAPRSVLIRGFGPTLADFGVTGAMANPYVELYSGQTLIATNDDWQTPITQCDAPAVSCGTPQDIQATGKDACTVATTGCSQDAAILVTLPPGAYTAIMRGVDGGTGVGLIGVDDNDTSTLSKLVNISTRGPVLTGDSVMIGGFIVSGSSSKTVLIRGFGPTLTDFGVSGAMSNPYVELYSGQTLIATNDDWQTLIAQCDAPAVSCGTPQDIQATGKDACSVATTGCSQDAAILVTLPPGAYTAIMRGVSSGTGVGLVGIDEIGP